MSVSEQENLIIVGAGAAGLWLAIELLNKGALRDKHLFILEKDENKGNDRTWCFWERKLPTDSVLSDSLSHNWSRLSYGGPNSKGLNLFPFSYFHIRSSDFYKATKSTLQQCDHISFIYESVVDFNFRGNSLIIFTDSSRRIKAEKVFTSAVEPFFKIPEIELWQSFIGHKVRFNKNVFDDDCFTLMDFDIPQNDATRFVYMLPYSRNLALIEITQFGREIINRAEALDEIVNYARKFSSEFKLLEKEEGRIPMSNRLADGNAKYSDQRIIPIGTISGAIKPTTGYGFLEMRRRAGIIAEKVAADDEISPFKRTRRFAFYDRILLKILEMEPDKGKEVFISLLSGTPPQLVFKFLDEKTNFMEDLRVFRSLPFGLFLKYFFKAIAAK